MTKKPCKKEEYWKSVVGYEGIYSVSNLGRVRSDRNCNRSHSGFVLKPHKKKDGYLSVTLCNNKHRKGRLIHGLVVEAFIGKPKKGFQVNHKNGIKADNNISNLEIVTCRENLIHAWRTGLCKPRYGEEHHRSKLTEKEVVEIRRLYKPRVVMQKDLAKMFNVSKWTIQQILYERTWKFSRIHQA